MKYIHKIQLLVLSFIFMNVQLFSQDPVPPPPNQETPVVLTGATIHIGNGEVIENAAIAFRDGKITFVGSASEFDENGYEERDVTGQHIYPGFILPNSAVGLEEVSSVRAMSDSDETGELNPNVRAQIAYNTDSEFIPTFRYNGILTAESTPNGGLISGTSAVMKMEGWNWEDATLKANSGVHVNWPGKLRRRFDFSTFTISYGPNPDYNEDIQKLEELFEDAISYAALNDKDRNLKLEALQGLFSGELNLVIHSNQAKSIVEAVKFAKKYGVKRVAVAGDESMLFIADFLVENDVPVIIPSVHSTPATEDSDYDAAYKLAVQLSEKGINVSLSNTAMLGNARNIPFFAGTCVAHGMGKEEALKLITLNPAKYLGLEDQLGTLENGKNATLFVSDGDALDMRSNKVTSAFIDGREITLDAKQQWLYKKYSDKYGHSEQ